MRLLVVEDEDRLAGIVKTQMGAAGFVVDLAGSAADAVAALELTNYDAAVLDLGLPDRDGVTVLAAARGHGQDAPDPDPHRPRCDRGPGCRAQCWRR